MTKTLKTKRRESAEEVLVRLSERMFPDQLGAAVVTVESREADGDGVLHNLLYSKETYPVQTLIDAGADMNAVGNQGFTPLHVAAWRDHAEAVDLLLSAGANKTQRCNVGKTARDIAREAGYANVLNALKD